MTKSLSTPRTNRPWARSSQEILKILDVSSESGLAAAEINRRGSINYRVEARLADLAEKRLALSKEGGA